MVPNKRVIPSTNHKLAILDPITFPKERSGKPSKAAFILTISSGAEVGKRHHGHSNDNFRNL